MKFTIDVDTGGTHTHGFIAGDGQARTVTTPTTPHDLTVCLFDCIKQAAQAFGIPLKDLLLNTDIVRYSTTTGTNAMIQKTGSRIGLIVSKGYEDSLYSPKGQPDEDLFDLVSKEMITSVEEEIDKKGNIVRPLNEAEVIEKMQFLIDSGARTIVVSLRNANANRMHEKRIRQIIKDEYPSFYLGSVKVFLSGDVSDEPGDYYQTTSVLIDAYVHDIMVRYLYKAEDDLRKNFYMHPLMVCNSRGGAARVAMTKAIDTYNSGPVGGLCTARKLGQLYNFDNVVTTDIGGTSEDIGLIRNGEYTYELLPQIAGVTVNIPMIDVHTVGLAGGSIISLDAANNIKVGPGSAGARPGPACFDLGGREPTITDADVVLGYIDPAYFLGGRMKLNREKAVSMIQNRLARKLNMSVPETACMIRESADRAMQETIRKYLSDKEVSLSSLPEFISVVYGGAGATHCCGFNSGLKFAKTVISPFASAFSAFGSSMADLLHVYSKYIDMKIFDGFMFLNDYSQFNEIVRELLKRAQQDICAEGFSTDNASFYLELNMQDGNTQGIRCMTDKLELKNETDVKKLCALFNRNREKMTGIKEDKGSISLHNIILNALVLMPHWQFKKEKPGSPDPQPASKGSREVFWNMQDGYRDTPIYERELLPPGNRVPGPAIVEARDTTYVVPANWVLSIDEYSNAVLEEV